MSASSTWFVPTNEFETATSDYAFCGTSALTIQNAISAFNEVKFPIKDVEKNYFIQMTMFSETFFNYPAEGGGLLLYADASETDPKNWQSALRDLSKKPLLEELPPHLKKATHALGELMRDEMHAKAESDGGPSNKDMQLVAKDCFQDGGIAGVFVDYVVGKQGAPLQKELLTIMSGQSRFHKPRPIILLVGTVIDVVSSTRERKTGLAYAYDFAKRTVIIKSFSFDVGQPPFTKSWFRKNSTDYYYLCQPVSEFVKDVMKEAVDVPDAAKKDLVSLAKYLVGDWVSYHSEAFGLSEEAAQRLDKNLEKLHDILKGKKIPHIKPSVDIPEIVLQFKGMRWALQHEGDSLRTVAVKAKEAGMTIAAENMAKYYDKTIKDLKRLAEKPNEPFSF